MVGCDAWGEVLGGTWGGQRGQEGVRVGGWEGWLRCDVGGAVLQYGKQPLHIASEGGHVDVASLLIEKGAPLDGADAVSGVLGG